MEVCIDNCKMKNEHKRLETEIRCIICSKSFHVKCLEIDFDDPPIGPWTCLSCREIVPKVKDIAESVFLLTQAVQQMASDIKDVKQALKDEQQRRHSAEVALRDEEERRRSAEQRLEEAQADATPRPSSPVAPLHLPVGIPPPTPTEEGMSFNDSANGAPAPPTPKPTYGEIVAPKIRWFNGADDVLSNLHDCPLYAQGHWFSGSESIFQWRKAKIMRDFRSAQRILEAQNAHTSMKIGVAINPDKKWFDRMIPIMQECQVIKAQQYPRFREELISTGDMQLKENTDHPIWGGRNKIQCNAFGSILEQLRDDINTNKIKPVESAVKVTDADSRPPPPNPAYSVRGPPPRLPAPMRPAPEAAKSGPQHGRLPTTDEAEQNDWQIPRYHRQRRPPQTVWPCFKCGDHGHDPQDCPHQPPAPQYPRYSRGSCYRCGEHDHQQRDCPYQHPVEDAPQYPSYSRATGAGRCYRCGEFGHHKHECGFDHAIQCSKCGGYGHKLNKCPSVLSYYY